MVCAYCSILIKYVNLLSFHSKHVFYYDLKNELRILAYYQIPEVIKCPNKRGLRNHLRLPPDDYKTCEAKTKFVLVILGEVGVGAQLGHIPFFLFGVLKCVSTPRMQFDRLTQTNSPICIILRTLC